MGDWSGLAPAVDAHLARWRQADLHIADAQRFLDTQHSDQFVPFANSEWGWRWTVFGMSYGLPDVDGVPQVAVRARDGDYDTHLELDGSGARLDRLVHVVDGATIAGREQFDSNRYAALQGAHLATREHRMLAKAISHYVSAPVCREVTAAANLADNEPLFETDLFTPYGFAVFEEALVFPDLDPDTGQPHPELEVWIRAIGWCLEPEIASRLDGQDHRGVSVFLYTTAEDYRHGYYASARRAGITVGSAPDGGVIDPDNVGDASGMMQVEVLPWCFGVNWDSRQYIEATPGTVPMPVAAQRRWFLAFMRLMWQEIIVTHPHRPKRAELRRWERLANRKPLLDWTVLRLRRERDPAHVRTGTGSPLDHQVLVRPHWRRQHFRTLGEARLPDGSMNPESHRLIWIEEHMRGPDDGPLGAINWATAVVR